MVLAAKQATSVVPIVFVLAVDPVGMSLIASLAHPGGNVTGLSHQNTEIVGKRVELLREFVPGLRHRCAITRACVHRIGSLHRRTWWYLGAIPMRREAREWVALINSGSARFASISRKLGADQPREWPRRGKQ
jgi:ABC transporter substrate binding protein